MKAICCFLLFLFAVVAAADTIASLKQEIASPQPLGISEHVARSDLNQILSAPEFSEAVHGPSLWELWERRLLEWLGKQFANLFKSMAKHPSTVQVIFWLASIGALGLIAFLVFQLFQRDDRTLWSGSHPGIAIGTALEWIHAAQSAQARGDLNQAIQCLYWASVVQLQEAGALPKTVGLTPRELLRSAQPSPLNAPLQHLTAALERFWYARTAAGPADFAHCLQDAEALGCKLA